MKIFRYFKPPFSKDRLDDLKIQFRDNCKKYHPDVPGGSDDKFRNMKSEWDEIMKLIAQSEFHSYKKKIVRPLNYKGRARRSPAKIVLNEKESEFLREMREFALDAAKGLFDKFIKKNF